MVGSDWQSCRQQFPAHRVVFLRKLKKPVAVRRLRGRSAGERLSPGLHKVGIVGMDEEVRTQLLELIVRKWNDEPDVNRPNTLWIAEYEENEGGGFLTGVVNRVWILDEEGLKRKKPEDFVRFRVIHSGEHWATGWYGVRNEIFGAGRHEIGTSGFASTRKKGNFQLEWNFGGLNGGGQSFVLERGKLKFEKDYWVS